MDIDPTTLIENTAFRADDKPHINVDGDMCHGCKDHPCLRFCPSGCFTTAREGGIDFYYVGCLECGTCLILCNRDAVSWNYPKGGYGIINRF